MMQSGFFQKDCISWLTLCLFMFFQGKMVVSSATHESNHLRVGGAISSKNDTIYGNFGNLIIAETIIQDEQTDTMYDHNNLENSIDIQEIIIETCDWLLIGIVISCLILFFVCIKVLVTDAYRRIKRENSSKLVFGRNEYDQLDEKYFIFERY